jgi:hypothetical protein
MSPADDLEFASVLHNFCHDPVLFEDQGDEIGYRTPSESHLTLSESHGFPLQYLLGAVVAPSPLVAIKTEPDSSLFDSLSMSGDGQIWQTGLVSLKMEASPCMDYVPFPIKFSKSPPFTCPLPDCGRKYRRKGDLKVHCVTKHPGMTALHRSISTPKSTKDGKTYPCPVESCRCGFKWERDLRRHIKGKHMPQKSDSRAPKAWARRPVEFNDLNMCRWKIGRR